MDTDQPLTSEELDELEAQRDYKANAESDQMREDEAFN